MLLEKNFRTLLLVENKFISQFETDFWIEIINTNNRYVNSESTLFSRKSCDKFWGLNRHVEKFLSR